MRLCPGIIGRRARYGLEARFIRGRTVPVRYIHRRARQTAQHAPGGRHEIINEAAYFVRLHQPCLVHEPHQRLPGHLGEGSGPLRNSSRQLLSAFLGLVAQMVAAA